MANVLGERVDFNEILSVMYREGQKMSWHDDGEDGEFRLMIVPTCDKWHLRQWQWHNGKWHSGTAQ